MTVTGMRISDHSRDGLIGLFDHVLGLLKEKAPTVATIYGRQTSVTPLYTASFPKDYTQLPSVAMDVTSNRQEEVGLGQMAWGPTWGDESGVHNITQIQLEVWGANRFETEAVANAVMKVIQKNKRLLSAKGIRKIDLFRSYDRPYDPNAPRMWFGSMQAPGEIWAKVLEYIVKWDYTWSPNDEDGIGHIKKIEIYEDIDGITIEQNIGLEILALLDSQYLTKYLGKRIKTIKERRL